MKINRTGYHFIHNGNLSINRPNGSGDYLLLVLKTPAAFILNNEKCTAAANSFIFFNKGTPQIYRAIGTEFINDWIHFDFSEREIASIKKLDIPFNKIIPLSRPSDISDLIRALTYSFYSKSPYKNEIIELYTKLIFIKLSEKLHYQTESSYSSFYESISLLRSTIYNEPYNNWTIDSMSRTVNLSRSYFQHMYKKIVGTNAMNDVIQSRIEYAKHLLSSTSGTVVSISEKCGYSCEAHFMRQFKKMTGKTPKEYRRDFSISMNNSI